MNPYHPFILKVIALTAFCLTLLAPFHAASAQAGLVSHWPAEGTANDVVGGNNGTLLNGAGYRQGVSGQAFSFDGVDDLFQASTTGFPIGNSDRTMAMWVKVDAFVTVEAFFGAYGNFGSPSQVYYLGASGSNLFLTQWGTGAGATGGGSGPSLQPGRWYHVAATNVGNLITLYLDGIVVSTASVSINTPAGTQFYSGRIPGVHGDIRRLQGAVDEIRVYNRALSASEIQTVSALPAPQSRAYVTHQGSKDVKIIDLATNLVIGAIPLGVVPNEIALSPNGTRAYVTLWNNTVAVIDTIAQNVISTIATGPGPFGVAIKPDGDKVYVTNNNSNTVSVINATTNAVIATVTVGINPVGVAITPDGARAYVTNITSDTVSVIDTATDSVTATLFLGSYPPYGIILPWGINITPDGTLAFVTNVSNQSVTVINTSTNTIVTKIGVGIAPRYVDFSPTGNLAYVSNEGGGVSVIDTSSFGLSSTISGVGISPFGIALSSNGNRAYVASYNTGFAVIDTTTNAVIKTIPMAQGTFHVAIWGAPNIDSTPPVITPTVTGAPGDNGWYTGDVGVSWSVTDPESSVSSSTACDAASVTADTASVTFTCSATSAGGTNTQAVTIKRDTTGPSVSCGAADGSWHAADVSVPCSASDATSGLSVAADASFTLSTSVLAGSETANAVTGSRLVCDDAGNCTTGGPITGNRIDRKAPTITITAPTGTTYLMNQLVAASFSCQDSGSGVATCDGPGANGGNVDTTSIGSKTFTVSATDNVANATTSGVSYTVSFGLSVLYDQTRAVKSGSVIPIKIQLVDALGQNISSAATVVHSLNLIQITTSASEIINDAGNSNPDANFRFDPSLGGSGGYIFNLKTTGLSTGTYQLSFTVGADSTIHTVQFSVRQ